MLSDASSAAPLLAWLFAACCPKSVLARRRRMRELCPRAQRPAQSTSFWPPDGGRPTTVDRRVASIEALYIYIRQLSPQSEAQHSLQSQSLTIARDLGRARVLLFEQLGSSIPVPFLIVLVFWLTIIFASFGLFAPRNGSVIAVFFRLCPVRLRRDIPDPGARLLIRSDASGLQHPAAHGARPARPLEECRY